MSDVRPLRGSLTGRSRRRLCEQAELLQHDLEGAIDKQEDSIRIYRLREPHGRNTFMAGRQPRYDIRDPLVL